MIKSLFYRLARLMNKIFLLSAVVFLFLFGDSKGLLIEKACAGYYSPSKCREDTFQVFDGTGFIGKPDLSSFGMLPIRIIYSGELWGIKDDKSKLPDKSKIQYAMTRMPTNSSLVVIDVEHWPVFSVNGQFNVENMSKLMQLIYSFKKNHPNLRFGYYGIPAPEYWRSIIPQYERARIIWTFQNYITKPLVDLEDAVFLSLYTSYEDRNSWLKYAIANIKEARKIADNKPVYVFLWPQYHTHSQDDGARYIGDDYWKLELETAKLYADGIVIWGGYNQQWDENAGWWKITEDFMKNLNR